MTRFYNLTYFQNHPEEATREGVLYCVVLVHKRTMKRECLKIGIASGRNWKFRKIAYIIIGIEIDICAFIYH